MKKKKKNSDWERKAWRFNFSPSLLYGSLFCYKNNSPYSLRKYGGFVFNVALELRKLYSVRRLFGINTELEIHKELL